MDKSKKLLLISLLPILLTLTFILNIVLPAIGNMGKVKEELNTEKTAFLETQKQLDSLKKDRVLSTQIQKLKEKLVNFNVEIPSENNQAVLLVDLEKFAKAFNVKILSVNSDNEKIVDLSVLGQKKDDSGKPENKKKKKEALPVELSSIALEIKVVGYYTDILNFVSILEKYQRKIVINDIMATNFKADSEKIKPRVEMTINCNVYKLTEQQNNPANEGKL